MRALAAILLASLFVAVAGKAASLVDDDSGNKYLPYCRDGGPDPYMRGFCVGMIETVWIYEAAHKRVCAPDRVNRGQARAVVVKYLENHPERLHEDIHLLAQEALQTAWPRKPK
jgi:hypothetical protein